jgi:hypothetical protein
MFFSKDNSEKLQLLKFATLRLLNGIQADKEHPNWMVHAEGALERPSTQIFMHKLFHS